MNLALIHHLFLQRFKWKLTLLLTTINYQFYCFNYIEFPLVQTFSGCLNINLNIIEKMKLFALTGNTLTRVQCHHLEKFSLIKQFARLGQCNCNLLLFFVLFYFSTYIEQKIWKLQQCNIPILWMKRFLNITPFFPVEVFCF